MDWTLSEPDMLLFWRKFTKFLFLILNFFILALGGGVTTVGFVVKFQTDLLDGYVTPLLKIIPSGGGTEQDVYTLYNGVAIAMMAFGGFMVFVGTIGCVVGTCSSRGCLLAYAVLMTILLLVQITGLALLGTMQVGDKLLDILLSNFVNTYKGDEARDQYSDAWNYMMVEFDCCAVNSYKDFTFCYWDRQKTVDNQTFLVEIPVTCCKVPGEWPSIGAPSDSNCTLGPTDENSYMNNGCYSEVEDYLWRYKLVMMITLAIAIAVEIAASVALIVYEYAKKQAKRIHPDTSYQPSDTTHEKLK